MKFTDEMKTSGFELIPEGVTILKVTELSPVLNMGKVKQYKAVFKDSKNRTLFNRYDVSGKYATQAMRSLYTLLTKGCDLEEDYEGNIDETKAVGCYIVARVKHNPGNDGRVYQNLGYILAHAESFDDDISEYRNDEESVPKKANPIIEEDPYA